MLNLSDMLSILALLSLVHVICRYIEEMDVEWLLDAFWMVTGKICTSKNVSRAAFQNPLAQVDRACCQGLSAEWHE